MFALSNGCRLLCAVRTNNALTRHTGFSYAWLLRQGTFFLRNAALLLTYLQLLGDHVKVVLFSCSEYEARNYGLSRYSMVFKVAHSIQVVSFLAF